MQEIRHTSIDLPFATREAYNELHQGKKLSHSDSFYLWFLSLLKMHGGERLVDISCGQGRMIYFAQKAGYRSIGVDFAASGVVYGKNETPLAGWVVGDGQHLPLPSGCTNFITHIGSLEHYHDPEAGIREIARLLMPDGVACILVPNSYGLVGNIKYVARTGYIFDDGQPLQRYNSRGGWHDLLVKNGLIPFRTLGFERPWPRTWSDLGWYLVRPSKVARLFASWFIPVNLANSLVYLCHRSTEIY